MTVLALRTADVGRRS